MKKQASVLLIALLIYGVLPACTIGAANGTVTQDGRPVIWKVRDPGNPVTLHYNEDYPNRYIGIGNAGDSLVWMGLNELGFAILNSYSGDLSRMGNGETMRYALGYLSTIEELTAHLDSTNITGRTTHTNYAVMDATGAVAMFEVGTTEYWRYDCTGEEPWIVRTNFSFAGGGGSGMNRYQRSLVLIDSLVTEGGLSMTDLLHVQNRDFALNDGTPITVPWDTLWSETDPWGYAPTQYSINNSGSSSACVIQGILPGEDPRFSTFWGLLGNPTTAMAFPAWPVGPGPEVASGNETAPLYDLAEDIRAQLFDYTANAFVDSWKLRDGLGGGYWEEIFTEETANVQMVESIRAQWNLNPPADDDMLQTQNAIALSVYNTMNDAVIPDTLIARISVDSLMGEAPFLVHFQDRSLHNPAVWMWDIDSDGEIDSQERNPAWLFTEPGTYDVSLTVTSGDDSDTATFESIIVFGSDPAISAEPVEGRAPLTVQFGITPDLPWEDTAWDFDGDGTVDLESETSPQHTYQESGLYQAAVQFGLGGEVFSSDTLITVHPTLQAAFSADPVQGDAPLQVQFTDASVGDILAWSWDMDGDGAEDSAAQHPLFTYHESGTYTVHLTVTDSAGSVTTTIEDMIQVGPQGAGQDPVPAVTALLPNHPNPFNPQTTLRFNLSSPERVRLDIFNIPGQRVRTLIDGLRPAGQHQVVWNGRDDHGRALAGGIYLVRLRTSGSNLTRRIVLLK